MKMIARAADAGDDDAMLPRAKIIARGNMR